MVTSAAQAALPGPPCKTLYLEEEGRQKMEKMRIMSRNGQTCPLACRKRQPWIKKFGGKLSHHQ